MIEIRHFSVSILHLILSGTSARDVAQTAARGYSKKITTRRLLSHNQTRSVPDSSEVRADPKKVQLFRFSIAIESVRNPAQIEFFNSKTSRNIHLDIVFANKKWAQNPVHEGKDIAEA
jgi:hypothetical protein